MRPQDRWACEGSRDEAGLRQSPGGANVTEVLVQEEGRPLGEEGAQGRGEAGSLSHHRLGRKEPQTEKVWTASECLEPECLPV